METVLGAGKVSAASLFQELEKLLFSRTGIWASQEAKEWLVGNVIYLFQWSSTDEKVRKELAVGVRDLGRRCAGLQAEVSASNQLLAAEFEQLCKKVVVLM